MDIKSRLQGSLICGAIGDAIGGRFEGGFLNEEPNFDFDWFISDDTQLTLATCEAIFESKKILPEEVAGSFLSWYNKKLLTGLGASTLKALRELQAGGHWALVGRSGEYAAGNGAAMRIAPLAFKMNVEKQTIRDVCRITHKNDEAYSGALAIFYSIRNAINGKWRGEPNLIELINPNLPDTRVRDRFLEFKKLTDLSIVEIGRLFMPSGFVVDSVPIAVFAAQKVNECGFQKIMTDLIRIGGDTDTICSMAGQIIGALKGVDVITLEWMEKYNRLEICGLIDKLVKNWREW